MVNSPSSLDNGMAGWYFTQSFSKTGFGTMGNTAVGTIAAREPSILSDERADDAGAVIPCIFGVKKALDVLF